MKMFICLFLKPKYHVWKNFVQKSKLSVMDDTLYRKPSFQTLPNGLDISKQSSPTTKEGLASSALKVLWATEVRRFALYFLVFRYIFLYML